MKNIPVKVGWELYIPMFIIIFFPVFLEIKNGNWNTVWLPSILYAIVMILTYTIRYQMDREFLYIRNSVFGTTRLRITGISKIEKTWNMLSSPAPAVIGRVKIYSKDGDIIISPKNFMDFERELLAINPNIKVVK